MRKITIERILSKPERYENNDDYNASANSAVVEWVDDDIIPRLVFGWRREHNFYLISKDEADALKAAGFLVEESRDDPGKFTCSLIEKSMTYVTFMNFRRYGWSWAPGNRAETGYAGGHTYANGAAFGSAVIPELVIRDSLISTWCEMVGHGMTSGRALPRFFDCGEVHELLDHLLSDAIMHMTRHAHQGGRPTGYFKGRVINHPVREKRVQPQA